MPAAGFIKFERYIYLMKKLLLPDKNGKKTIYKDEVIFCEADGKYTKIYVSGIGKIVVCKCLKELENVISCESFCRIHHKYLVNINFLKSFAVNSKCAIILEGNITLPVSVRKRSKVKRCIKEYFK